MIKIRKFQKKDTKDCGDLIRKVYIKFNYKEDTEKSSEDYASHFSTDKNNIEQLENKFLSSKIFFVALDGVKIVGLIRGSEKIIKNLFIDGRYHNKGIGKKLIEYFEKEAIKNNVKEIKLKSSLYAIDFYKKQGYKKTTGIRSVRGLKIQPMKKSI